MASLQSAVIRNDVERLRALLDADPERVDEEQISRERPLHLACGFGCVEVAELLLDRGAEHSPRNRMDDTPLTRACMWGHAAVVSLLLARGVDPSERGRYGQTALIRAISDQGNVKPKERLEVVRVLLRDARVSLDARDRNGRTALWWACDLYYLEVARMLLLAGADRTIADNQGVTPEQLALARAPNEGNYLYHRVFEVRCECAAAVAQPSA